MDPSAGHQQPTSPLAATGGAPAYYPPPPAAAAAAAPPPAAGYYPPPPQAAAAASDGQPAARPHYAAAAGTGALPEAAPAAAAPAPSVVPGVGSKRSYDDSGAGVAAADGYGHAAADAAAKRHQLDVAAAAPAAAVPTPAAAAAAAPASSSRPSAASIPRETIYRLVLDVVDTALIIGRGGNTVRSIEQATGGRIKRLQEPPGAREQTLVIWNNSRELPAPNRMGRNTAQEALMDCVKRVVFQENAPMGQPAHLRFLIGRSQEAGVAENIGAIMADNPGVSLQIRRELPPCALDNDVIVEVRGEKYALVAAVELLSHVLREFPILERPGGPPPALRGVAGPPAAAPAAAPPAQPAPGQYSAPAPQYGAPPPFQYGAPSPGQYGAPPPGQYGAPAGYAQPAAYGARPY